MPHLPTSFFARTYATWVDIGRASSLLDYFASAQLPTISLPPASAGHLATPLLQEYTFHGFPVEVGPEWSLPTIRKSIAKGAHTSTLTYIATAFC